MRKNARWFLTLLTSVSSSAGFRGLDAHASTSKFCIDWWNFALVHQHALRTLFSKWLFVWRCCATVQVLLLEVIVYIPSYDRTGALSLMASVYPRLNSSVFVYDLQHNLAFVAMVVFRCLWNGFMLLSYAYRWCDL